MHEDGRVDLIEEFFNRSRVFGDDRFGVVTGIALDMGDGGRDVIDRFHRDDGVLIFGFPVFLRRGFGAREHGLDRRIAADFAAFFHQRLDDRLEVCANNILVHQQGFGGPANTGAAHLGVEGHADGLVEIGGAVDIDVHQTFEMRKDRYPGFGLHTRDQRLAAARHDDVDIALEPLEHFAHRGAIGGGHQLHAFHRQAGQMQSVEQTFDNRTAGMKAVAAATQDHGIARFDTQGAGIGSDIGARFKDHPDDAERRAHALDMEPVGAVPFGNDAANRIGQFGNCRDGLDDPVDARIVQQQPVEKGL